MFTDFHFSSSIVKNSTLHFGQRTYRDKLSVRII
jgi:hypothetical protein